MQASLLLLLGGCAHLVDGQDVFLAASDVNLTMVGSPRLKLHDWQDSYSVSFAHQIDGFSDSDFTPDQWDKYASLAYSRLSSSMTAGFDIWKDLVQINTVKKTSKGSAIEAIWTFIDVIRNGMLPEVTILINAYFKCADMMKGFSEIRNKGSEDFKDAAISHDSTMNNIKGAFLVNQQSFYIELNNKWKKASSSDKKALGKKAKAHMRALLMSIQSASKFAIQYMKEFMEEVGGKYATYVCDAKDSHWKTCDQSPKRGCTQRWYFDTKGAVKESPYMMNAMITQYQKDVDLLLNICPSCGLTKDFSMDSHFGSNIVTGKRYKWSLITAESSSDCDGKLQVMKTGTVSVPTSIGGLQDKYYYECPNVFASDSGWCNL